MDDQQMFDRTLNVFWMVIKWLFKLLIYTPIFFTAFVITFTFMKEETSSLAGLAVMLLVSFILYQAVYFLKGMLIQCR